METGRWTIEMFWVEIFKVQFLEVKGEEEEERRRRGEERGAHGRVMFR